MVEALIEAWSGTREDHPDPVIRPIGVHLDDRAALNAHEPNTVSAESPNDPICEEERGRGSYLLALNSAFL